jgi:DnaJ domain
MATKQAKMHGRVEGAQSHCAVPGCAAPGEYKAPLQPANFDGPGAWRFLCLDHVREHNAKYNFFEGMSTEEITEAQSPLAGWDRPSRKFAANGADPPPAWSDFTDPLDAISTRFGHIRARSAGEPSRFSKAERRALSVLGLGEDADRRSLRQNYSSLVRRFHPDKNGGDRRHEGRLGEVIEAYQLLRKSAAFA